MRVIRMGKYPVADAAWYVAIFVLLVVFVVSLWCMTADAQELQQSKFMDRAQWSLLVAHSAARSWDTVATCRNLARGAHEDWIPAQSCSGVAAWNAGAVTLGEFAAYRLHRAGHDRWARVVPFALTVVDVVAIAESRR